MVLTNVFGVYATIRATAVNLPQGTSRALVSIRPHHLRIAEVTAGDSIRGTVQVVMPMGANAILAMGVERGRGLEVHRHQR